MKRILKLGVTGLCLLQASLVYSDNLMDVYREALIKNPNYLIAETNLKVAQEFLRLNFANLLPSLDIGASGSFSTSSNSAIDAITGNSETTSVGYSASINQVVYDKAIFKQYQQAKLEVDKAAVDFKNVQQGIITLVADRYFNVLSSIDDLDFSKADLEAISRQLEQTKQRFEVGLVAITDVHEAQAVHDSAVARNIVAKNFVDTAYEELRVVTGTYHKNLATLNKETPLVPPNPASIDEWTKIALDNNLNVQSAKLGVDISRDNISIQQAGHYPFLGLSAGYNRSDSDTTFEDDSTRTFKPETASIRLSLGLNIYAGGAIKSRTQIARYQLTQSRESLEDNTRLAQSSVRSAYLTVVAGVSQVQALQQAVVSNESALQATEAGFEVGTRTTVDVLDARTKLLSAAVELSRTRYKYILDRLFLQSAAGQLDEEEVLEINNWLH